MNQDYDSIRPYSDQETSIALKRVADAPELSAISTFLFGPGEGREEALRALIRSIDTIDGFQAKVMAGVIRSILKKTSTSLEVKGLEHVGDGRKHVLMSNHRDIILDPAIMQLILFDHKVSTTEIAVGGQSHSQLPDRGYLPLQPDDKGGPRGQSKGKVHGIGPAVLLHAGKYLLRTLFGLDRPEKRTLQGRMRRHQSGSA